MNIASWFSSYKLLASQLEEEKQAHAETRRKAEDERRVLTDALARASNKQPIYDRPPPETPSTVPVVAFGPTASAARQAAKQKEEEDRIAKRQAHVRDNGQHVEIPQIPNQ